MWRLGSLFPANMSSLQLVEVCPVVSCGGGRKTETANSVDRRVRVFTVKKRGKANVYIVCHSEPQFIPTGEPLHCEAWQQKNPHATLRRGLIVVAESM
jgi:hypothetical protein